MKELIPQIQKAFDWVSMDNGVGFLLPDEHCPTRDIFQARADKLVIECASDRSIGENAYLLGLVIGEIGNNTFDHNLGNWRDERGAYFVYNADQRMVVIADRGQGILATLRQVRPSIADDCEALTVAFTETLSGRAPERRGNGLKLVAKVVQEQQWKLEYRSGCGTYVIDASASACTMADDGLKGMVAILTF